MALWRKLKFRKYRTNFVMFWKRQQIPNRLEKPTGIPKNRYRLEIPTPTHDYIKLFQAPWKISFTFQSFILHDVKLAQLSNKSFEWKNGTFFLGGGQNIFWPSYIFSGVPQPRVDGGFTWLTGCACAIWGTFSLLTDWVNARHLVTALIFNNNRNRIDQPEPNWTNQKRGYDSK